MGGPADPASAGAKKLAAQIDKVVVLNSLH